LEGLQHIVFSASWYPSRIAYSNGNFIKRHAELVATFARVSVLHAIADNYIQQVEIVIHEEGNLKEYIIYYPKANNPFLRIKRYINAMRRGWKLIGKADINHVHVAYPAGLFAWYQKLLTGQPYIISEHWSGYLPQNSQVNSWQWKYIHHFIYNGAKKITAVSKILAKHLPTTQRPVSVIGNIVNDTFFRPMTEKPRIPRFIHVSNFAPVKRVPLIIDAAIRLAARGKKFELYLVGEEHGEKEQCKSMAVQAGLLGKYIFFEPFMQPEPLAYLMHQSLGYISMSMYETQGITMLEALASGLPIITSNIPVVEEYIENGFGIYANSSDEICNAMENILEGKLAYNPAALQAYAKAMAGKDAIAASFKNLYALND
jgi:glycosyltransferase involved in cell wall biosynthesis